MSQGQAIESPFACNRGALTAEQWTGHRALIEQLFKTRQSVRELPDGYALGLPADDDTLLLAARFIMLERRCCPFFDFALEVEREGGPLWLRLSGREGAKEVLRTEFDLA